MTDNALRLSIAPLALVLGSTTVAACWTRDRCREAIAELADGCEVDSDCVLGYPTQYPGVAMSGQGVDYSVVKTNADLAEELWVGGPDCQSRYYPSEWSSSHNAEVPVCNRGVCEKAACDPDTYEGHCPGAPW